MPITEERRQILKAILEEQETSSRAQAVAAPPAPKTVRIRPEPASRPLEKPAAVDGYETCLELAAQFIARG
jgi:hypothetical protein